MAGHNGAQGRAFSVSRASTLKLSSPPAQLDAAPRAVAKHGWSVLRCWSEVKCSLEKVKNYGQAREMFVESMTWVPPVKRRVEV